MALRPAGPPGRRATPTAALAAPPTHTETWAFPWKHPYPCVPA
jgi:hypothetical protein